jgi:hypothetical protein
MHNSLYGGFILRRFNCLKFHSVDPTMIDKLGTIVQEASID